MILIIGILAAIAIPAFLHQRAKAYDPLPSPTSRPAQIAEETYATDNNGAYTATNTATAGDPLVVIEPTLHNAPYVTGTATGTTGYVLTSVSAGSNSDTFVLTDASGVVSRQCSGTGGGCICGTTTALSGSW